MTSDERSDILHIMKINRLTLIEGDSAHLKFAGASQGNDAEITILVIDNLPSVTIKRGGEPIFSETVRSVDDLKIFLEERLYTFLH